MKKITLVSVLALLCLCVVAQEKPIKSLTIGDTVPDIIFANLINYPSKTAKLSDFRDKLIILDLWSSSCRACIEAFPKMQRLQEKFNHQIQVILANPHSITYDNRAAAINIINSFQKRTGINLTLPVALDDTIINRLFPHQTVPHVVIIDTAGKVLATTTSAAINEKTVQQIVTGQQFWLPIKNELGFDYKKPLFVNNNGGNGSQFLYRTLITGYLDGAEPYIGWDKDSDGKATRYYIINYPLRDIYRLAYPEALSGYANRIIVEADAQQRFQPFKDTAADLSLLYTYENNRPPGDPTLFKQQLTANLEHSFNATAVKEIRTVKCYALKFKGSTRAIATKKGDAPKADIDPDTRDKAFINQPVTVLVDLLNTLLPVPVLDKTGLTNPISIRLPYTMYQYTSADWKRFLGQTGFALEEVYEPIELGIIKNIR